MSAIEQRKVQRELLQPFTQEDLEWRVQASGEFNGKVWARIIAYVTNRAIQQRLDDVVGMMNWKNEFLPLPNSVGNGAMCGISIKFGDEWITKFDGADNTNIESTKGGLSGSMKRAAVQWGIGRYLYEVKAHYAECIDEQTYRSLKRHERDAYEKAKTKIGKVFYWKAPPLNTKYLPKKHLGIETYKTIKKLIKETGSKEDDICSKYGVDDLKDLYVDEAGDLTTKLLKIKNRQQEERDADTRAK